MDEFFGARLKELEGEDLRRRLPVAEAGLVSFGSNDYLGLRRHPVLIEAARGATAERGAGAGASRLIGGDAATVELEAALAAWKQKEAALVFSSGYAAALGTIPALVGRGDTVILDKLAHASLIDGARLSGATVRSFAHNDVEKLESLLGKVGGSGGRVLIVTESVFSMDGDVAPLGEICDLKDRFGAWLMVDEAHGTGLYGATGAGLLEELSLSGRVEVVMATLSKALGSVGGMVAGSRVLVDWLVNRARSFIFSTALPPGAIGAGRAAVDLVRGAEGAVLRERLRRNVDFFREGLPARWREKALSTGAIQPLLCGEASAALALSRRLREMGFFVPAIRFPTVPRGGARLRVTLSAEHRREDIAKFLEALDRKT